jgi:hypothetical protein
MLMIPAEKRIGRHQGRLLHFRHGQGLRSYRRRVRRAGVGSPLYWLSRELGSSLLGLEQFRLGHERGAAQDHSRIIRLTQHQSEYAALAPHAYEAFYEVEDESARFSGERVSGGTKTLPTGTYTELRTEGFVRNPPVREPFAAVRRGL